MQSACNHGRVCRLEITKIAGDQPSDKRRRVLNVHAKAWRPEEGPSANYRDKQGCIRRKKKDHTCSGGQSRRTALIVAIDLEIVVSKIA